ncbi:PCC domain-containing protein [Spiroplasma endosymbiont of Panorpa germanica]|uniref:PCC domain-containing protein n=1 Tax=Spiroplasma endosymbiont of Panorpa germanica TaxID=3066314 RepID=UPI0030D22863
MEIKERSNRILIVLNPEENIKDIITDVILQYGIIEASIIGFGYLKQIEYGILENEEPIFYQKHYQKEAAIISSFNGSVTDRNLHIHLFGITKKSKSFGGHFINGIVGDMFSITIDVFKTE